MANENLPRQNSSVSDGTNFTPPWYNFFRRLADRVTTIENAPAASGGGNSVTNIYGFSGLEKTIQDANTTRTLISDDSLVNIEFTNAGAITVTVPKDTLPENSVTYFTQGAAGQVTVVAGAGVTIDFSDTLKTRTQESMIGLKQIQVNKFELFGDTEPLAPSLTVLARSVNSSGAPAFLAAASNGTVLRRIGDALGFSNVLASEVTNTPAGNIAAVTVQAAIAELDAEKAPLVHTHVLTNVTDVTMTVVNLNALDDGVNTALHFHDTDRARANHTGTQLAATVSDFSAAADARIGLASINALADVVITTPSATQVIKYDGANWVNATDATGAGGSITATTVTLPYAARSTVTVTDATVTATSKIIVGWGNSLDTDTNESEMDDVTFKTKSAAGTFALTIASARNTIGGIFKINYQVGA